MGDEGRSRPGAILIAGPTASGKSALALALAARLNGVIVNADSMQVYRDLAILTSRPSPEDMASRDHRLYGSVDGAEAYSVNRWLADAKATIEAASAQGRTAILVGGTGLYFKALTQGLSPIPDVPEQIRRTWRDWADGRPAEELHAELGRRDPKTAAGLRPTDPQRLLRALEVHAATGEGLAAFQNRRAPAFLPVEKTLALRLDVPRPELRARIDARFEAMLTAGALAEVANLLERRLDPTLPVMRAIGVPELARYLGGESSLAEAVEAAKAATRQYVRRQETFARHQLSDFRTLSAAEAEALVQSSA